MSILIWFACFLWYQQGLANTCPGREENFDGLASVSLLQSHMRLDTNQKAVVAEVLVKASESESANSVEETAAENSGKNRVTHTRKTVKPGLLKSCVSDGMADPEEMSEQERLFHGYLSQSGEDARAQEGYFKGLCGGTYIELGALDGLIFSNTYMFNRNLDWHGVLIEADPENFAKLSQNRKDEIALHNVAVCNSSTNVHWVGSGGDEVHGIFEFMSPSYIQQWHKNLVNLSSSELSNQPNVSEIACLPLTQILEQDNVNHIDLFSLDVEGAELEVLDSVDFARTSFGLLIIESNGQTELLKDFLEPHGYKHVETYQRSDYFVNDHFKDWYGHDPEPLEPAE